MIPGFLNGYVMYHKVRFRFLRKPVFIFSAVFLSLIPCSALPALPLANLNDPKVFTHVRVADSFYRSLDEEVRSLTIRIRSDRSHTFALVPNDILALWKEKKIPFRALRPPLRFTDIDPDHRKRLKNGCVSPDQLLNGYHDNALNELYLKCAEKQFPGTAKRIVIGKSVKKRNITALRITIPDPAFQPVFDAAGNLIPSLPPPERDSVLVHCGIHGNEIMAPEHCLDIISEVLTNQDKYPVLRKLHLWVIPVMNPDGYHDFWFTHMREGRKNGAGVDLNRNFPFRWNSGNPDASSDNPRSVFYRGPAPASEPETKALLQLFEKERFVYSLSYHCYASSVLIPYSISGTVNPEPDTLKETGEKLIEGITMYRPDKEFRAKKNLYEVDGTDQDTFYNYFGTFAYVVESSHLIENYNFVPRIVRGLRPIWQNMLIAYENAEKIRIKVTDESGKPLSADIKDDAYVYSENERRSTNPATGMYTLIAPDSSKVKLTVTAPGFSVKTVKIRPSENPETMIIVLMRNPE